MKISIIGGGGGMGQFTTKLLLRNNIDVSSIRRDDDYKKKINSVDAVLISVPEGSFDDVLDKLKQADLKGVLLIDLSSRVSAHVEKLKQLSKYSGFIHFLFGPTVGTLKNQNIIVSHDLNTKEFNDLISIFKNDGARVTASTPDHHDEMMALTQALSQFSSISLAKTLSESSVSMEDLEQFSTVTSSLNMEVISRIVEQKPELWSSIQFENSHFNKILKRHKKNIEETALFVDKKDYDAFRVMFDRLRVFWKKEEEEGSSINESSVTTVDGESVGLGVLGPAGTYSDEAASIYDNNSNVVYFETIPEIIRALASGKIEKALLPMENSIQGTILETLDGIYRCDLKIVDEVILPIKHCIAGIEKKISSDKVQYIYSHPQAIAQSSEYLERHYPHAKHVMFSSTAAGFVKIKHDGIVNVLGVGPLFAARRYGLNVVDIDIQNTDTNETLFVAVMKEVGEYSQMKNTLLAIHPNIDRPGLLYDILRVFREADINLLKIESRPSKEKLGEYIFYIKADVSPKSEILNGITKKLKAMGVVKVLTF